MKLRVYEIYRVERDVFIRAFATRIISKLTWNFFYLRKDNPQTCATAALVCQGDSLRLRQTCISLCTRPSVSGVLSGAWHRPRSLYTSHARLYFNRGSSETLCCVKAEGLEPGVAITSVTKSATAESPAVHPLSTRNFAKECATSILRIETFAAGPRRWFAVCSSMEIPKDVSRPTLFKLRGQRDIGKWRATEWSALEIRRSGATWSYTREDSSFAEVRGNSTYRKSGFTLS